MKHLKYTFLIIATIAATLFFACEKDDDRPPISVQTISVSNTTATTATCLGNVISDGGSKITTRGVCWSTSQNPTISDNKTTNGTGIGSFTSNITGLSSNRVYFVKAYAKNSKGTAYGSPISFTTTSGTITDYDGNIYGIVTIGSQTWMAENLKTTHYANGAAITLVESSTSWDALGYTDKAMCYYDNSTTNKDTYGALYTWAAAMNGAASSSANPSGIQGACPDGWHVPSDAEWKKLEMYLGMSQSEADGTGYRGTDEGSKLKSTSGWNSDGNGTNSSGFTALPAGRRGSSTFGYLSDAASFWSATEYDGLNAQTRSLYYSISNVGRAIGKKNSGLSVRCIKN